MQLHSSTPTPTPNPDHPTSNPLVRPHQELGSSRLFAIHRNGVELRKHVLVEKPVAIKSVDVARLAAAASEAKKAGLVCMPAMCMRFWPGWEEAREAIRDGRYGKVLSATFQRLGSGPTWGGGFYKDFSRSGGAVIDLHIHDTDFVVWCFGKPASVKSCGDGMHITTQYVYSQGPSHVVAEGAWDLAPGAGFRMRYLINCERATLEFDLSKTPMAMVHHADRSEPMVDEGRAALSGYDGEVRQFVRAIEAGAGGGSGGLAID